MDLGTAHVLSSSPPLIHKRLHLQASVCVCRLNYFPNRQNVRLQSSSTVCKNNKLRVRCSQVEVEEDSLGNTAEEACELVNGTELIIGDGIEAYLFKAVKNNNSTGILLLSDIFGFQDSSTRDFAYRVACGGYNVIVPDLFNGDPWSKDRPSSLLEQWISKQKAEAITEAISASAKWMVDEFESVGISKKLGIIGFCYGGGRVVDILAKDQGAYFGCGVSFYGTNIDIDAGSKVKVPLLVITGENDALCPVSTLKEISERNKEWIKMVVFKGRGHGFAHRPQSVEEDEDAEEAFVLMRDWLTDGLLN
ncbi:uncharacterized protein LOC127250218 isoform X2 [Andrographis paniculata]|uniref:uncharacterized protein LOC127250218 isoform X2 n=1 Tax=Andrographis paniculata TaxID=175694 RepID=UPI0021E87727|nr:uncharacterized protein LOC127250218 isoform X2 [Andrographis paniculata]